MYISNGLRALGRSVVIGAAALAMSVPIFGQQKYEDCVYRTPDKKAWCTKMSGFIGCQDSTDGFYATIDGDRMKFFGYGQPSPESRVNVIAPNYQCVSGNCEYRGSPKEVEAKKKLNVLMKRVIKAEYCTQDMPRRKMLGKK